jgi:hypothetical protein
MLKLPILAIAALSNIICAVTFSDEPQPRINVTTIRDTDMVEIKVEMDMAIVAIQSPFGISEAKIERLK